MVGSNFSSFFTDFPVVFGAVFSGVTFFGGSSSSSSESKTRAS